MATQVRSSKLEDRYEERLKSRGVDYVKHPVIRAVVHGCVRKLEPDFLVPAERLVIEVNGCFVHGCEVCYGGDGAAMARRERDAARRRAFESMGYFVDEVWEHELVS